MKNKLFTICAIAILFVSCKKEDENNYYNLGDINTLINASQPFFVNGVYSKSSSLNYVFGAKKTGDEINLIIQLDTASSSTVEGRVGASTFVKSSIVKFDTTSLVGNQSFLIRYMVK